MDKIIDPDWSKWGCLITVQLWEAVLLAVNLEPSALRIDWRRIDGGDPFTDCGPKFLELLRIVCNHVGNGNLRCSRHAGHPYRNEVNLSEFADWWRSMAWPANWQLRLPEQFPRADAKPPRSAAPVAHTILLQWYEEERISECKALGLVPT